MFSNNLFSIIIPSYGRPQILYNLLNDLSRQSVDLLSISEIIVFNDGNSPGYAGQIEEFAEKLRIRYLFSENRIGLVAVRNECLKEAEGRMIIFLDDDIRVSDDFLNVCQDNSSLQNFCFNVQNLPQQKPKMISLLHWIFRGKVVLNMGQIFGGFTAKPTKKVYGVQHFPGCCFVVDRQAASNLQFDSFIGRGNAYLEDADFSYSLYKRKRKLYLINNYSVQHVHATTGGCRIDDYHQWLYYYWNHKSYFVFKHGGFIKWGIATIWVFVESIVVSLLKKRFYVVVFLRGWIDGRKEIQRY